MPVFSRHGSGGTPQNGDRPDPSILKRHSRSHTSVPSFSRPIVRSLKFAKMEHASLPRMAVSTLRPLSGMKDVKRWDGLTRSYSDWDGLRRDPELWSDTGDCMVHLYSKGSSQRGPSFRFSYDSMKASSSGPLFTSPIIQMSWEKLEHPAMRNNRRSSADSGYLSDSMSERMFQIYMPVPEDRSRDDALHWHLTTRNFFAWMFNKPLVGSTLGKSLVDLHERMVSFRSDAADNTGDLLAYADMMGYLNFAHSPDYALALLHFAEHLQLRDLWTDAFAHCVGMNESLCLSREFEALSRRTKALITRSYLEMDLHLGRVTRALSNLLEDELSPANLGLAAGARAHLDRFRSFLHTFYVAKLGYWPPPQGLTFAKPLIHSMYSEFNALYEYLVDRDSSHSVQVQNKPASGGICVLQNVNAFNTKHNYEPLVHPLPLLPRYGLVASGPTSPRILRSFMASKSTKSEHRQSVCAALMAASNGMTPDVMGCPLIQAYIDFEQAPAGQSEEKLSLADARKVRWIMIYSVLQTLASVVRSPAEVRDSASPSYHMCCLVSGAPQWTKTSPCRPRQQSSLSMPNPPAMIGPTEGDATVVPDTEEVSSPFEIHPDCESDYLQQRALQLERINSPSVPAPLRINTSLRRNASTLSRTNSLRSIQKSVVSSFSRHNSILRTPTTQVSSPGYTEILVEGYGNGTSPPTPTLLMTPERSRSAFHWRNSSATTSIPIGPGLGLGLGLGREAEPSTPIDLPALDSSASDTASSPSSSRHSADASSLMLNAQLYNIEQEPTAQCYSAEPEHLDPAIAAEPEHSPPSSSSSSLSLAALLRTNLHVIGGGGGKAHTRGNSATSTYSDTPRQASDIATTTSIPAHVSRFDRSRFSWLQMDGGGGDATDKQRGHERSALDIVASMPSNGVRKRKDGRGISYGEKLARRPLREPAEDDSNDASQSVNMSFGQDQGVDFHAAMDLLRTVQVSAAA